MRKTILIVDDEEDIRLMVQGLLEDEGYQVYSFGSSEAAFDFISKNAPHLVIQDIWLQGSEEDGIGILKKVKAENPDIPFIMISGHGTIETAVSAIKYGAYDFIEKPFNSDRLLLMVHRALENSSLKRQNAALKARAGDDVAREILQIPEHIRQVLDKVAATNSRVFLTGETGTGKGLIAQYLHEKSARNDFPFMTLNCAGKSSEVLEDELFGGSNRSGLLEAVNGGTLLLDDVVSLPIDIQGKILTLLQDSAFYVAGEKIVVDIRVIATASCDPESYVASGEFREDLFYRLNVVPIELPSLKQRRSDIEQLIELHSKSLRFSPAAMNKLMSYAWPGNLKQFNNVMEWLSIMYGESDGRIIEVEDLPPEISENRKGGNDNQNDVSSLFESFMVMELREAREHFERHYLLSQVNRFDGNISKTAEFIGMERSALHRKLKSLDVFSDDKKNVA